MLNAQHACNLQAHERPERAKSISTNCSKDGYQSVSDTCQLAWNFHEMPDMICLRERAEREICERQASYHIHLYPHCILHKLWGGWGDACEAPRRMRLSQIRKSQKTRIVEVAAEGCDSQSTCIYRTTRPAHCKPATRHAVSCLMSPQNRGKQGWGKRVG